jgi:tripartite-type tricarboxylate transporter receptor subunit TctC
MNKFLILLLLPLCAYAWEPTKPVQVLIGTAPGSGNEISFREAASVLAKIDTKTKFIVENRPGADSALAANALFDATPDGHTMAVLSHMSLYVTNDVYESKIKKFNYDSFTEVLTLGKSPLVLVANVKSKVNTPKEFADLVVNTDKPINVAIGGGAHKTAYVYLMNKIKGANKELVQSIQFNGPNPTVLSVAQYDGTGTEFGIMPITIAQPLIQAGRVKAIGLTGTRRLEKMPEVPLLNDIAPGINVYAAWVLCLPPNTPKEIVTFYRNKFAPIIRSKEYKAWRDENLVFYEESELKSEGVKVTREVIRKSFLDLLQATKSSEQ